MKAISTRVPVRRAAIAAAIFAATQLGCVKASIAPPQSAIIPVAAPDRLYYDDGRGFRDSTRMVIRDVETWQSVWQQATEARVARPLIDFQREMVALVAAGAMRTGDRIHVDRAGEERDMFVILVRVTRECREFPGVVYPTEIVRVPRWDGPIEWREEQVSNCD